MGGLSGVTEERNRQAMAGQTCPLALGATVAQDVDDPWPIKCGQLRKIALSKVSKMKPRKESCKQLH